VASITRDIAVKSIQRMTQFHKETNDLFEKYGMDLLSDLGRRNTLLSTAQEKFFSDSLRESGYTVSSDGRPGQPDIIVTDPVTGHTSELECKLTTRNSSGGVVLQTDYETLQKKGTLDYLYVIASPEFTEFCVLYFTGLTSDDFRVPAAGSRGKAGMVKHRCYNKATVLMGEYRSLRADNLSRLESLMASKIPPWKRKKCEKSLEYWRSAPDRHSVVLETI
jgi:hypothetical protein